MVSTAILLLVPMMSAEGAEKVAASGERYVVVLSEEVGETEAARLASVYGGVLEPEGHGGRQFVVRMASSRARMMSLDPHVVSVSEQSRHLTPLPTGSGSTTLDPYAYDGSGNVKSIGPAGKQEQYVYDALGRLTSATAGVTNTQTYQYDAFGNRTVVTRTGSNCTGNTACEQQGTYLAETNHLDNNGAAYDAAGNLTAYVADRYAYDAAGMLARASVSGDRQYLYTAFDERIAVYDGTFNWRWKVRSEDGKVLREFTSTNDLSTGALGVANRQWVKDYVWRNGQLLATENRKVGGGTVTEHYHLDHLGTPRLVTDGTGLKLATHTYYAFGAELMGTPESPEAGMKFTGHERDITGTSDAVDNMHARYYSSLTGRFLSVDPAQSARVDAPQTWNRYAYAHNNPVIKLDPDGRAALAVVYPDYRVSVGGVRVPLLGHAGVVSIDTNGHTKYYEYGRYDSAHLGVVRHISVPDVVMQKNGFPTNASLAKLMSALSERAGHGGPVEGAYFKNANASQVDAYAQGREAQNTDATRKPYNLFTNSCSSFMCSAIAAGGGSTFLAYSPRPASVMLALQKLDSDMDATYTAGKPFTTNCHDKDCQ